MARFSALWRGLVVVELGFLLGLIGIGRAPEAGTGEAFAALGAAIAAIGGSEIGRGAGERRANPGWRARGDHTKFHLVLWVSSVVAAALAVVLIMADSDHAAAAVTLIVAAIGVSGVHHLHESITFTEGADGDERLGWALIGCAVASGTVGIVAWQRQAEFVATIAAGFVTFGGTLLGHARGRQREGGSARAEQRATRPAKDGLPTAEG